MCECGWIPQFALECSMTIQLTRKSTFNFQQAIGFSVKFSHPPHFHDSTSHAYTLAHPLIECDFVSVHCILLSFHVSTKYIPNKHANTSINFIEIDKVCV